VIYSTVNYGLGTTAPAPLAAAPGDAMAKLEKMKDSLRKWLSYRTASDSRVDTDAEVKRLARSRMRDEQALTTNLYTLLTQAGFPETSLPVPDVKIDPNAAVELAELVISGETPAPAAQGFVPFLIAGGVVAGLWAISSAIKSQADLAAEKERLRCIQSGACTDYGFWLKVGGISAAAWVVWSVFKKK